MIFAVLDVSLNNGQTVIKLVQRRGVTFDAFRGVTFDAFSMLKSLLDPIFYIF